MLFRVAIGVVVVVGVALGWYVAAYPSIMLGRIKDDYVTAAEAGGLDMSKCKARQKSIFDPSGGMAMCTQDVYQEIQRQIDEIEKIDPETADPGLMDDRQEEPTIDD